MKKLKKSISLNKLVISKLTNPNSIMGGSVNCTDPKSDQHAPVCPPPPPPPSRNDPNCTVFNTNIDC